MFQSHSDSIKTEDVPFDEDTPEVFQSHSDSIKTYLGHEDRDGQ